MLEVKWFTCLQQVETLWQILLKSQERLVGNVSVGFCSLKVVNFNKASSSLQREGKTLDSERGKKSGSRKIQIVKNLLIEENRKIKQEHKQNV